MAEVSNLGYVVFGVSDLDKWERFAVDVIGMQVGNRDGARSMTLRMDEYASRIFLEQTGEDDLARAGWLFDTEDDLEMFVRERNANGKKIVAGGRELAGLRGVEKLYICDDPNGIKHELAFGPTHAPIANTFRSQVMKGGFETGALGVGHILIVAKDYRESVGFYRENLGLRISDYIRQEVAPGIVLDATFFHSRTGRHHSLATTFVPGAKRRLNHFMVQVQDVNDVGLAYDRCLKAEVPVFMGIGHHPNDHMISFYVVTPSGFAMEYGYGGVVIDDANWEVKSYTQLSDWGHHRGAGFTL